MQGHWKWNPGTSSEANRLYQDGGNENGGIIHDGKQKSFIGMQVSTSEYGGIYMIERTLDTPKLVAALQGAGDRRLFVLESRDLLRWKLAAYVPVDPARDVFIHEGNMAEWERPGELKIVMRTCKYSRGGTQIDPPCAYSAISTDGGRSWTSGEPEPDLHNTAAKGFFGKHSSGHHIYVYNDGKAWVRKALKYKVRAPGGSWGKERTFYFENNRNSYPALIEEDNGQWLCVWDSSDDPNTKRTAIRFGRLALDVSQ